LSLIVWSIVRYMHKYVFIVLLIDEYRFNSIMYVYKLEIKPLLIIGSTGMMICMIGISMMTYTGTIGIITLVFMIIFTASFMMSWGPIAWVLLAEIFPNRIRSSAMALRSEERRVGKENR